MVSDIRKLRDAVNDLADVSTAELDDEAWYNRLWELLDPVIDARAGQALGAHQLPAGELPAWARGLNPLPGLGKHDYEPDGNRSASPMQTDPPCRICGQSRRDCEKGR